MAADRKKERAEKSAKLVSQYKSVFQSEAGRAVLADLANSHYVKSTTFSGDCAAMPNGSLLMAIREGERNVVLRILFNIGLDPATFLNQPEEEATHVS